MPRNDQVTRQLILLRKLEGSRGATLHELSAALPPDLVRHTRTIRRDLEALESTFPLITERRNGQTCWRLMDGYANVLPLALSTTELMALVFSKDLLKPLEGTQIKISLDSALNKATAALPAGGAAYVEQMHSYFSVGMGPHKIYRQHRQTIDQLSRAISQTHTVQMRCYTASRDKTSHREVDPYHTRHQELRQSNTRTVPDSKPVKPYNPWAGRIGHLPHRSQRLRSFSLPYNPPGLVKSRPRHWLRN